MSFYFILSVVWKLGHIERIIVNRTIEEAGGCPDFEGEEVQAR